QEICACNVRSNLRQGVDESVKTFLPMNEADRQDERSVVGNAKLGASLSPILQLQHGRAVRNDQHRFGSQSLLEQAILAAVDLVHDHTVGTRAESPLK